MIIPINEMLSVNQSEAQPNEVSPLPLGITRSFLTWKNQAFDLLTAHSVDW
jgi:hypothetical protein